MDKRKFVEDGATPKAKRVHVKASSSQLSSADESGLDSSQLHDLSSLGNNADHGIIDRIYLKNFMCHGKLEFNFGPNVNFVVGRNGSGKSAIMTALVVGLGGKASVTSRGSSLKNFIKDGKNVAEISIILRNEGTDAYKSELYGPRIRIERRITSDGATSYKLKSHKGHVVSNKREELTRIMDQFNIQVDNPVSILNQDTSRNFLFTKDPRDKYKFFMKATQLEQIESHYALIQEQKTITEDKISMKEEGLPDLEKDALEKEQRFKDIESLNTLREKREKLLKVLAWAHVTEIEQELDVIAKSLNQEENRLPKFETKVEESQVKVSEAEGKVNEVKQKITELTKQMEEIQPQLDVAKGLSAQSRRYVKDLEKQIRSIQQSEARDRHDMKDCQRKIEELKQSATWRDLSQVLMLQCNMERFIHMCSCCSATWRDLSQVLMLQCNMERFITCAHVALNMERFITCAHVALNMERFITCAHVALNMERFITCAHVALNMERFITCAHVALNMERFITCAHVAVQHGEIYHMCSCCCSAQRDYDKERLEREEKMAILLKEKEKGGQICHDGKRLPTVYRGSGTYKAEEL
ncbi:hypothetical protein BSL78_03738 [Apostichopus japonicus]|uniref:Structural maintenance of chromosomes protein 6 n=1 Tax=Stichopus japonicus TaxID=307972 RepID=A0A2G8LGD2_STIJA|nr:hypothetical protein BSL78_03738 [Apostichopus japonicus]